MSDHIETISSAPDSIAAWVTSADQSYLLQRQQECLYFNGNSEDIPVISVNSEHSHQPIEGFGFSLTGGSAMLISRLSDTDRNRLLRELFLPDGDGIGVSFLRLSIGSSDLSERCFSYDDMPEGQADPELAHFDIEAGDVEVIPLLQEILAINPDIKIIATAWSAPPWMKTSQAFRAGKLKPDCYGIYAAYLVLYLQAMRDKGIVIHAITPQNEPLNQKNEPSMLMEANEQAEFVKNHLGPALASAGLADVEIFCWDHNCDVPEYPLTVFADTEARRYLAGSAWHLYGGDISALSEVHKLYPDMKLYFTEQWVGSDGQFGGDLMWHVRHVLIGSLRNWSRAVLEWNLASDPFYCPHTPGGEARCVGALTIGDEVSRNVAYYIIAHAAKFVRPGSVRIESALPEALPNVALKTPDGYIALIVLNDNSQSQSFSIRYREKQAIAVMPAYSVATYVWRAE
jgi:glucosylceramidase